MEKQPEEIIANGKKIVKNGKTNAILLKINTFLCSRRRIEKKMILY